jgi:tetratricopeptide (TPR) repeat protein
MRRKSQLWAAIAGLACQSILIPAQIPRQPGAPGAGPQDAVERAKALAASGQISEAEALLESRLKDSPDDVALLNHLGQVRYAGRNWARAAETFERARRMEPSNPAIAFNLGLSYFEMQDHGRAEKELRASLELRPGFAPALITLGRIQLDAGRMEKAERELKAAVAADPSHPLGHYHLGTLFKKLDRLEEARAALDACLRLDPDAPSAHLNLGLVLVRLGEKEAGEEHLRVFKQLSSASTEAVRKRLRVTSRLLAARDESRQGRLESALVFAREAEQIGPEIPQVQAMIADLCARLGRKEESDLARREYERLLKAAKQ